MVERYPIWATPYSNTYAGSQHHSNRDRYADVNGYSEPGAYVHADTDRDLDTFAKRHPHSFSNSIAKPRTHVHPNGDGDASAV